MNRAKRSFHGAVLATLLIGLSGCVVPPAEAPTRPDNGPGSPPRMSTEPDQTPRSAVGEEEYSQRALMFAEMMIPHHQQAVDMSLMALDQSNSEEIKDLAGRIIDGQSAEITQMQGWLDAAGQVADGETMARPNMMGNSRMGGMASEEEILRLQKLEGSDFDALFLPLMIEHHEGGLMMVRMITGSSHPEVAELAGNISSVQREEIEEMNAYASQVSGN